eukprot:TRINITY_DN12198_c0_g1_i1.p2 TRINITY_DN12198_c0_g1~~TRINITY_DN12198_c0_g1_i1.p2  ORF type:complete len:130 (-),score=26.49 TRINITY_DN12198_c0_g1_i1:11-400(-)
MGMGRRRDRKRAGWPDNLYPCKNGYKYRNPVTKKESWLGVDFARAVQTAKAANAHFAPADSLLAKVLGEGNTLRDAIKVFRQEDMPHRGWKPKTLEVYESVLNRIEAAAEIGRAVQQECRDRSRMPSSA